MPWVMCTQEREILNGEMSVISGQFAKGNTASKGKRYRRDQIQQQCSLETCIALVDRPPTWQICPFSHVCLTKQHIKGSLFSKGIFSSLKNTIDRWENTLQQLWVEYQSEHTGFIHTRAHTHTHKHWMLNTHTSHIPNNELTIAVKGLREYSSLYAPNA